MVSHADAPAATTRTDTDPTAPRSLTRMPAENGLNGRLRKPKTAREGSLEWRKDSTSTQLKRVNATSLHSAVLSKGRMETKVDSHELLWEPPFLHPCLHLPQHPLQH